ncbi:MAG: (Fe-S)-binding protein [Bacteroidales bacterium]|nr:(Fe-S)-binding protein [Bacteroidales bacterium]
MNTSRHQFTEWPTDLLIDYALKVHHRGIREAGPALHRLIHSIKEGDPVMEEISELFGESLNDLENHLLKEEQVLFPYLYDMLEAQRQGGQIGPMHCGSISFPIGVMMTEHDGEVERHQRISKLTNGYTAPEGASDTYRQVVEGLKEFSANLHEHIHIENDIIFPRCQTIENEIVG